MTKTLLFIFLLLSFTFAGKQLTFQLGRSLGTLTRSISGSGFSGNFNLNCNGGVAPYTFEFLRLPDGWTASNNVITVPNMVNIIGNFVIRVRVTDSVGNTVEGDISLSLNGLNVSMQSVSGGSANVDSFLSSFGVGGSAITGSTTTGVNSVSSVTTTTTTRTNTGPDVSNLYQNYPGLAPGSNPIPDRITIPDLPTGNPSNPNIVPSVITNSQATYITTRDARTVTIDEVKRNAAFNRQLNANKGVANLLAIIQQLTANINAAKNDIVIFQNQLVAAQQANNDCNNKIFQLSNTRTKIQNAIKDRQDKISEINRRIADLTPIINDLANTRDKLTNERSKVQSTRSPNSDKLKDLGNESKDCNSRQSTIQKQLDQINEDIRDSQDDIKKTKDEADRAPDAIDQINQQIPIVDNKIADLKRQLEDAQNEKAKLLQDRLRYQQLIENAGRKIRQLQKNIDNLKNKIPSILDQLNDQKDKCLEIQKQLDKLRNQIAQKQADYKIIEEQIKAQDSLLNDKKAEVKKLTDSIGTLPTQIAALQQQLGRVQQSIRRQYYICSNTADQARKAKQNLDAINNKYNNQSNWLKQANLNLEKARAEKELADIAVQQIISTSTTALPFSIVPNGNSATPAGSPLGNNPSGSPLGPVADRNQVAPGSPVVVGDLSTYLSQAYGAGVDPTKPSTVSTLYPISTLTLQAITGQSSAGIFNTDGTFVPGGFNAINTGTTFPNGVINTSGGGKIPASYLAQFSCSGSANQQGQGKVISVRPGEIVVQTQSNQVLLKIAPCTVINSINQNFTIVPQTSVYYSGAGSASSGGFINLHKLTCV